MKTHSIPLRLSALAALCLNTAVPRGHSQAAPAEEDKTGVFRSSLSLDKTPLQRGGAILKSYADMLDKV